jgi:hypothetical protein
MGVVRQVTAQHLVDGRPLLLEMQVGRNAVRYYGVWLAYHKC